MCHKLKRLLPIWWFTRRFFGSPKLRPFDVDRWWEGHRQKYQVDWEEFRRMSSKEREEACEDRKDLLTSVKQELKGVTGRAALLATIATAVLAADIFFIKDGNPSLMWLVKVAFLPLALNFFLLLILATPSFGSIYKRYITSSNWQRLLRGARNRYTKDMMLIDRYSERTDRLKGYQIRATTLLVLGGIPLGAALLFR